MDNILDSISASDTAWQQELFGMWYPDEWLLNVWETWQKLLDYLVPAIGKMSGCLTTATCRPLLRSRGRGRYKVKQCLKCENDK